MQGKRIDRVSHLVQMELSQVIVTKVKDPRLNLVTLTAVSMTPDLKSAYVYYSMIGSDEEKEASQVAFEKAKGYLQKQIAQNLKLRYTPKLEFRLDNSFQQGMEIDRILQDLEEEKTHGEIHDS